MSDEATHRPTCRTAGGPEMDAWLAKRACAHCQQVPCVCDEDGDLSVCGRCGGDGLIEYNDGDPSDWGEDCPSEANHLIECRECKGTGRV